MAPARIRAGNPAERPRRGQLHERQLPRPRFRVTAVTAAMVTHGTGPGVVDGTPIRSAQHDSAGAGDRPALRSRRTGISRSTASWWAHRPIAAGRTTSCCSSSGSKKKKIDANHRAHADPAAIDPIYRAAQGRSPAIASTGPSARTSAYFNETWSPIPKPASHARRSLQPARMARTRLFTRAAEGTVRLDQIRNRNVVSPVRVISPDDRSRFHAPAEPAPVVYDFNGNAANQTLDGRVHLRVVQSAGSASTGCRSLR